MSQQVYISNISLIAPGLFGWQASQDVLTGKVDYQVKDMPKLVPAILPANERRRTTRLIKLALQAAQECLADDLQQASHLSTVFVSSDGDMEIIDKICRALLLPEHPVSPTQFHNSVHNSPAGYWAIAADAQRSSTSLSACDESFVAGIIEAVSSAVVEQQSVLTVAYDYTGPSPIAEVRPIGEPFAAGFIISPEQQPASIAQLELSMAPSQPVTPCMNVALERLREANPAARCLPLLEVLARRQAATIVLAGLQSSCLEIKVTPCHT